MTVVANSRRRKYQGNGVATVFNGPMAYEKAHVRAYVTVAGVTSELSLNTDFDVERLGQESGTRVILNTAPPPGSLLTLLRTMPFSQDVDLTNQGAFHAETIEKGFDALEMQIQQLADDTSLALRLPEDTTASAALPVPVPNYAWRWSSDGKSVEYFDWSGGWGSPDGSSGIGFIQSGTGAAARTMQDKAREIELSVTDFDTIADAQAAAEIAAGSVSQGLAPTEVTLVFPRGVAHTTATTLTFNGTYNIRMDGRLTYTGSANEPAVVIGSAGNTQFSRDHVLNVVRQNQSDWSSEECVGVRIINHNTANIRVVRAANFTIGLQMMGDSGGCVYNTVTLGAMTNNKVQVEITNKSTSSQGWCNENLFFGGRFNVSSGVNAAVARYGVRIASASGTPYSNNNNVFVKPSFELNAANASAEAVAVVIERGQMNHFMKARVEGCDAPIIRTLNDSTENTFDIGYTDLEGDGVVLEEAGSYTCNSVFRARNRFHQDAKRLVFDTGPMHKKACFYDGATAVHVPGVAWGITSGSTNSSRAVSGVSINADYLALTGSYAPAVYVNTRFCKNFVVSIDSDGSPNAGRVLIECYDSAGALLTNAGAGHPYVKSSSTRTIAWSTNFGDGYVTGSESNSDFPFSLGADVAFIRLIVYRGSATEFRLRGFKVYSNQQNGSSTGVNCWTGFEHFGVANIGTAAPTAGTWPVGLRVVNATPATGQPKAWVCTVAGTPGTWVSEGNL